jgi:hypothetical protein
MAKWNYRVLQKRGDGEVFYQIHEVYYDEEGRPRAATVDPPGVHGDSLEDLEWSLEQMKLALTKPVLTDQDFEGSATLWPSDYRPEIITREEMFPEEAV